MTAYYNAFSEKTKAVSRVSARKYLSRGPVIDVYKRQAQYVTLLPKSITTAIGMGLAEEMGGIAAITVAVIIVTGIFGNLTASAFCRLLRIREPLAVGLAIGTSAHAMGTTKAIELGEVEGAMSSLAIVVSGLLTAVFASFFAMIY